MMKCKECQQELDESNFEIINTLNGICVELHFYCDQCQKLYELRLYSSSDSMYEVDLV